MTIRAEPHYRLPSSQLADWLEQKGLDVWWTTDYDPVLALRIFCPCTGEEIAAELRKLNRPLLVQDRREPPLGKGESITARDLDDLVKPLFLDSDPLNGRVLFLNWEGRDDDWALIEDCLTTESERQQAAEAARK